VGKACQRVDLHEATCRKPRNLLYVSIELDDKADDATLVSTMPGILLDGEGGNDVLRGGDGDDVIRGGGGRDTMLGGAGDDDLGGDYKPRGPYPADHFDGGDGIDSAGYGSRTEPVSVNLGDPAFLSGEAGEGDTYTGVEYLAGGDARDVLIGSSGSDILRGDFGRDRIEGLGGDDTLGGDFGPDTILGGDGSDTIDDLEGNDTIDGGCGPDVIDAGQGSDTIRAHDGWSDTIKGGRQKDSAEIDDGLDTTRSIEQLMKLPPAMPC
jgi:Ca2+-binding RTX toxin-like protein